MDRSEGRRLTYSVDEAAIAAGTSRARILQAIHAAERTPIGVPRLRAKQMGRRFVILAKDLEEWLESLPDA